MASSDGLGPVSVGPVGFGVRPGHFHLRHELKSPPGPEAVTVLVPIHPGIVTPLARFAVDPGPLVAVAVTELSAAVGSDVEADAVGTRAGWATVCRVTYPAVFHVLTVAVEAVAAGGVPELLGQRDAVAPLDQLVAGAADAGGPVEFFCDQFRRAADEYRRFWAAVPHDGCGLRLMPAALGVPGGIEYGGRVERFDSDEEVALKLLALLLPLCPGGAVPMAEAAERVSPEREIGGPVKWAQNQTSKITRRLAAVGFPHRPFAPKSAGTICWIPMGEKGPRRRRTA